jgi:competence protein ComEA
MKLSAADRRALGLILGLLVVASAARWLERPRTLLLGEVPPLDVAALEEASRAARPAPRGSAGAAPRGPEPAGTAGGLPAVGPARGPAAAGAHSQAATDARIDPNTASVEELQRLPGIGAAMAQRIVAERETRRFASAAELQRVRGIGPAQAARLAELVALPPVAEPAAHAPATPGRAGGGGAAFGTGTGAVLDLNRATAAELQTVPGVGPVLAGRLIGRRDSLGRFRDWADVDAVPGVGPALLARLMERARISP